MTAEVDWVLEQFGDVVDAQPEAHPLHRVDRDQSLVYETGESLDMQGPVHTRTGELKRANFVGVSYASRSDSPIGTEFDLDMVRVVGVRVEGLHYSKKGNVDPSGEDGVVFDDDTGLVAELQAALQAEREWPDVPREGTTYTHLLLQDYGPRDDEYADYFRHDFEVYFDGWEDLP